MRAVYGIVLVAGVVALIAWTPASAATSVRSHLDPEARFGRPGRRAVGLGMAGLSASFAGWPAWWAAAAALAGAGWLAGRYGPGEE